MPQLAWLEIEVLTVTCESVQFEGKACQGRHTAYLFVMTAMRSIVFFEAGRTPRGTSFVAGINKLALEESEQACYAIEKVRLPSTGHLIFD